jgi:DNA repair exonuclease SbcCD nuclease subunit
MVPKYRTKDFFKQIMTKWKEVFTIAKEKDCAFIVHGGDIFQTYDPDVHVILETMRGMDKSIPLFLTVGNHDYKSDNLDHVYSTTAMGLLQHAGYVKVPNSDIILEDKVTKKKVLLRVVHYFEKKDIMEKLTFKNYQDYDCCILVCHASIVNQPVKFKHLLAEDLSRSSDFDLVLCGHYHIPFDAQLGNTRFINPGSMVRQTRADEDMMRTPQVLIVDVNGKMQIEKVKLKTAVPWKEAYMLDEIEDDKEDEERLSEEFSEAVQKNVGSFNIDEVIDLLSEEKPELKEVVTVCRKYLDNARQGSTS